MTLLQTESFAASNVLADFATYGLVTSQGNSGMGTGGPFGDPFMDCTTSTGGNSNNGARMPSFAAATSIVCGFRVLVPPSSSGVSRPVCFVSSGGNVQVSISSVSPAADILSIYRGDLLGTFTLIGSITLNNPMTAWTYLEFQVTISATVGVVTVHQDGVLVGSLTGLNTAADTTNLNITNIGLGGTGIAVGGAGNSCKITHYYADTNTFLGPVRIVARFPSANGTVAFAPNGLATNWQNAAKMPPVPATDFNSDATVGAQDLFTAPAFPTGMNTVLAVTLKTLAEDTDAGVRTFANVLLSGATTAVGTAVNPPASPTARYQESIFETDPNTSAAWTLANANASEFGYKIVS